MNILMFTLGFYPATAWGGPVRIVHQNSRELIRRGHQVTVYCTNLLDKKQKMQPGTFEKNVDGIRVVYLNTLNLPRWPGTLGPVWSLDLQRYLDSDISKFDVVHLNGYRNLLNLPVVRVARRSEKPLILQPHGTSQVIINTFAFKRLYDDLLGGKEARYASAWIAGQESERQQILDYGIPAEKIQIIPNGLDLSEQLDLPDPGFFRKRYGIPLDVPLVLFLGRINKKKGADMLVEAFSYLRDTDIHLAIVGPDDGQMDVVKGLIARFELDGRVVLPGLLSGIDVWAAYQDADLFVLPCRTDTFPMTVLEACRVGTPMVITDGCEIAGFVKDRVADVVPFDSKAFAEAVSNLLSDEVKYQVYKKNCPEVMRDTFSVSAVVDKLENLYERVVSGNRPS